MSNSRALSAPLALLLLHSLLFLVSAQRSTWNTLGGGAPLVVARGGFSGILPDSSGAAYNLAVISTGPDVYIWCDVQLTKDGVGICQPDINLANSTYIATIYPNKTTSYSVNGVPTSGYFPLDYTLKDLSSVILTQGVYSRSTLFDGNGFGILTVDDLVKLDQKPKGIWLNIQHDAFYAQHNLSMRSFVLSVSRSVVFSYISSPEVGFLRSIASRFNPKTTKLVFRFMRQSDVDPSTNQTYGSLLKNLTFIKTFASGILVPKGYIWPVDATLYLQSHTSLVSDAHKAGLEVFASDFVNDVPSSFNYSYDPLAEYLQFVDNGDFSVDGVLSDFPITPFEAIGCFAHLGTNATKKDKTLVISKYGASGDYPACTDLAYNKAISDGVDVLDCPVQMSKDGTPFCLNSIDLIESTTVAQSSFSKFAMTIPEIKSGSGIFAFNLTWNDIKILTPYHSLSLSLIHTNHTLHSAIHSPMDRNGVLSLAFICIVVAGVGGQSPAAAPSNTPATPAAATPAQAPSTVPKSPAPVASPKSSPPAATPASTPAASPTTTPAAPAPVTKPPAASPPPATPPPATPPPAPVPVSSPPAPVPVSSPPAPVPVAAPTTPVAPSPAPKHKKKGKKHGAPAPSPLLGPPAPPTGAPGPSEDASSPGPGTAANDESGAETTMCLEKVLGGLALGWATLVLVF